MAPEPARGSAHSSLKLGVDTLCYHCRLVEGEVTVEQVLRESADLGFAFVQLNAVHVAGLDTAGLNGLRDLAGELGLELTLSGDVIGRAARGDTPEEGAERVAGWLRIAEAIGSPFARISSGFYRAELWHHPEQIRAEQDYVTEALRLADARNESGRQILLENHSDFTPEEYIKIIQGVGSDGVRVFLDLINPISVFADPTGTVAQLAPLAPAGHIKDFRLESRYVPDGFHRTGFGVKWCYPGEGSADLGGLLKTLVANLGDVEYRLSIEGLENSAGVADQVERLTRSLAVTRRLLADLRVVAV
jgi:sugar phosphate isomerase/epimerase